MTPRKQPPSCNGQNGWRARHWFHPGTSRPNSASTKRRCRNCGLYMIASDTPPRAKVERNWKWPLSAHIPSAYPNSGQGDLDA